MKSISEPLKVILNNLKDKSIPYDQVRGIETGFKALDGMLYGMKNGDLIVIGSRPAMGKTSFVLQVAYQVCLKLKKPIIYFSSEKLAEEISLDLLSCVSKTPLKTIRTKNFLDSDFQNIILNAQELSKLPVYLEDKYRPTVEEITNICRIKKCEEGLSLVVIDYLQLIKSDDITGREQQINQVMIELKAMARELNCPVLIISQLNRGVESRPNKRPSLLDLRESGTIEQIADVVMFVYRDEVYNLDTSEPGITEIIIAKNREGEIGTVKLKWERSCRRFEGF